jgi:hypothetical protein
VIVLYKKRNKGVVGVQDKEGRTWHTKGPFEDRDAMKNKPFDGKGAQSGKKKA